MRSNLRYKVYQRITSRLSANLLPPTLPNKSGHVIEPIGCLIPHFTHYLPTLRYSLYIPPSTHPIEHKHTHTNSQPKERGPQALALLLTEADNMLLLSDGLFLLYAICVLYASSVIPVNSSSIEPMSNTRESSAHSLISQPVLKVPPAR
ncbi:hypothetical protein P168DRAFT_6543 [Aspergillus campestris IBT 28561]|uniref:Uncharacterized protein n=1 Tax=Aspergillus campestris (strain IBT 28561) TaxID=1392248 RepID=A0A2I1DDR6_ASPC2|nr:uncharacterized protein P168DRAFT_6543 [Aspergillus campestris IBT 28561]PKY08028.1 hypothetical protein P168DRAFT_6543 [Aspergillus campestris IBT 28561]